tara:strand:+ start:1619 stop:2083 length:465 start_codon:yes stop_codon:yes gene_type:complete
MKKTRKPLSEERKEQLRLQLLNARNKKGPAEYKNIHPMVLAKPDADVLSLKNVKLWIKQNKLKASAFASNSRRRNATPKQSILDLQKSDNTKAYVRMMEHYLKTGDWISNYMGENEETKTQWTCIAMAYNSDGTPKRDKGVYYPDINMVWGEVV